MEQVYGPIAPDHGMVARLLGGLRPKSEVPLRLAFWNGWTHDLGRDPRVTVQVLNAGALRNWAENYEAQGAAVRALVSETTYRVWRIYLAGCAHAFSQNWVSLHQILACKSGANDSLNPTPWSRAYMYA